jgi:hypothetical protein
MSKFLYMTGRVVPEAGESPWIWKNEQRTDGWQMEEDPVIRDLYNGRTVPSAQRPAPLTPEEERRFRAILFTELGNELADHGQVAFPAYSPQERMRLVDIGRTLSEYWGIRVTVEAQDECAMHLSLAGHELRPSVARDVPGRPAGPGNGS